LALPPLPPAIGLVPALVAEPAMPFDEAAEPAPPVLLAPPVDTPVPALPAAGSD
jgi:hypothetical protein